MNLVKYKGKLRCFNHWVLLECGRELAEYYGSLYKLEYPYKPRFNYPLWGAHISVVRGESMISGNFVHTFNYMEIEFYYENTMKTNGVHFWFPVICPILDDIREIFGLSRSLVDYHLSVGNISNGSGETPQEEFI